MSIRTLPDVKSTKGCEPGDRVTFRAKVVRSWDTGGLRMVLAGDASGLTRVETGEVTLDVGVSYEFRGAEVKQYPGGWTSVSVADSEAVLLDEEIEMPQDEAYIEQTFKILSGIQRKKARKDGRLPPWEHPSKGGSERDLQT